MNYYEPDCVLIAYGTLRPGEENHWVMNGIPGEWQSGFIFGAIDRGARYPRLRPGGHERSSVSVFFSRDLPSHWHRLDEFEGDDYRRVLVDVEVAGSALQGYVYVALAD